MRSIPTLLLLAIVVIPAHVSATVVSLERDGLTLEHGEICRFAAGAEDNPFQRWLSSSHLTCVAAGAQMEFPAGRWNVFGRVPGSAISTSALLIIGNTAPATLALALASAGEITTLLMPGQEAVVYAPHFASAVPVAGNTTSATVPAGVELWLFVLEKGSPVALIPLPSLEPGGHREVDGRTGGAAAIVGWLEVQESDRPYLANARGVTVPKIRGTSGGPAHDSDELPPLRLLHGSFFRIAGISAGEVTVDATGPNWLASQMRVKVAASLNTAAKPLPLRAAGSLAIRWSARPDLLELDRSIGSCTGPDSEPHFDLTLSACTELTRPGNADEAQCQPVRHETYPADSRVDSLLADNLAPGDYRVEMRFGRLPAIFSAAHVAPFQIHSTGLLMEYEQLYGGVTFGGEPLTEDAQLSFPGGIGFAPKEKGEYRAVLRQLLDSDAAVTVAACDGSPHAIVLTDRPTTRNARLDIDIPANSLRITVTDTFTHDPIAGANIRLAVTSPRSGLREVLVRKATTGKPAQDTSPREAAQGDVLFSNLPDRKLLIVVTASGYQKKQVPPFSISKSEQKTLDVQLVPLRGNRGRIASSSPFEDATVYWYSPAGQETERADLGDDGTFVYNLNHEPAETMAIVSRSHPLWVLRMPAVERGHPIELRFPDGRSRSFEVFLVSGDSREERFLGLVIAGVRVPQSAMRMHQLLRRLGMTIKPANALSVRDLAETGPIDVILGPTLLEVDSRSRGMDVFTSPRYADAPRQRLEASVTQIIFPPK